MISITKKVGSQRIGTITTKSGVATTPLFMPIATRGAVKHISPQEVADIGFEVLLSNTYHLWLRPGEDLVANAGGLHKFINWHGSILTDSGGFQVFSLGARAAERFGTSGVELSDEGVRFIDPQNGKKYFMTPEKAVQIQLDLGTDIIMCLDVCPPFPCTRKQAIESLELTSKWANRCKKYFTAQIQSAKFRVQNSEKNKNSKIEKVSRPLLFGIVQGSVFEDLRKESAKQIVEIEFDGYAIGGVAVGEPREKLSDIMKWVLPLLPEEKARYLMGLGRPEEIVEAVRAGVDMFDCVIPTREGRHGRLFRWSSGYEKTTIETSNDKFYQAFNICNEKFKNDLKPFDSNCNCQMCKNYSRAFVRHLLAVSEPFAGRLTSLHNLTFYYQLMEKLRNDNQ